MCVCLQGTVVFARLPPFANEQQVDPNPAASAGLVLKWVNVFWDRESLDLRKSPFDTQLWQNPVMTVTVLIAESTVAYLRNTGDCHLKKMVQPLFPLEREKSFLISDNCTIVSAVEFE